MPLESNVEKDVRSEYLDHCWIPRRLFNRWLAKHELPLSPVRFEPQEGKVTIPRHRGEPRKSNLTPRDEVRNFIATRWPNGRPANVTRNVIQREFEKSPGGYLVSDRTVGRALGGK
jgi:hypothetical protein